MRLLSLSVTVVAASFALSTACSSAPPAETAKAEKAAAPEAPVSGKTAFWEMYKLAYAWAPDVQVLWLRSGGAAKDGAAPLWTAMFVSANKKSAHEFTYRAISEENKRKGVDSGAEQAWSGPTPKGQPFPTGEMKIDSDAAYSTAAKELEKWLATNGDKELHMGLGKESTYPAPVWSVYWGDDKKPAAALVINASDGKITK